MSKIISDKIRKRILESKKQYFCNDNISEFINDGERELLVEEVASKFEDVLKSLVIDIENDHNTQETAIRVAKAWVNEVFGGRYLPKPAVKSFPNATKYDQLYVTGPISIKSTCAHHFQNITGYCWVGVFPGEEVVGLSKIPRIVHWVAQRPQIQEEMTVNITDQIQEITKAQGVAVVVKAHHHCVTHRGVQEHQSDFTTSIVRGILRENKTLKDEFFSILQGMKGYK